MKFRFHFSVAINIWNSFPIAFNLLYNDYNIPTTKTVHKVSYQNLQITKGYNFLNEAVRV